MKASYTIAEPVVDSEDGTAVIEVHRHANEEKVCVAAIVMLKGTVTAPVVEEWSFGVGEEALFRSVLMEALSKMVDVYSALPAALRERFEADEV